MASCSILILFFIQLFSGLIFASYALTDTLNQGQLLRDYEQLVSSGGAFKLGFFSSNPTSNMIGSAGPHHLGIWFERIPCYPVWVANRDSPVPDSSGAVVIDSDGSLKITYQNGLPIPITSNKIQAGKSSTGNITATLLDSGNLLLRKTGPDGIPGPILWQSFDYPHNIFLPGMKLGMNFKTGQNWTLTLWISEQVPAPGAFRLGVDPSGSNQLLVWRRGEIYWSSGVWTQNGSFQSAPELTERPDIYDFRFVSNAEEKYFSYSVKDKSILSRWDLDTLGQITEFYLDRRDNYSIWSFRPVGPCQYDVKNSTSICLSEKPTKCRKNGSEFFVKNRGNFTYNDQFWSYHPDLSLGLSDFHAQCWKTAALSPIRPWDQVRVLDASFGAKEHSTWQMMHLNLNLFTF